MNPAGSENVDHETAQKAVFWAKQLDAREAQCPKRPNPKLEALETSFQAAKGHWDPQANGGKGGWRGGPRIAAAPVKIHAEPNPTNMDRTLVDGKVVTLADADDSVGLAIEHVPAVVEAEELGAVAWEMFEDRTGELVPEEVFNKTQTQNAELLRQSHGVAQKLQTAGVAGYTSGKFGMWLFDPVGFTGSPNYGRHAIEQPRFRRCNFIPSVAQQKRRPVVKLMEYWLKLHPHARFWTFTSGERCTLDFLRQRIRDLHRKISRLNAEAFMTEAGASIVFRATETGSLVTKEGNDVKNPAGEWLFHPHSHCLVELTKGRISKSNWAALLSEVRAFMGANWQDAGQIQTIRECAKYPMKPTDVARLSPDETVRLFKALHRLHLVQPLGSVKALKEEISEAGDTLAYKRTRGGPELVRVKNWNRHAKQPESSKADKQLEKILSFDDRVREIGPQVVATLPPGPCFGRVMRPTVLVCAERFGPAEMTEVCKLPHVAALIEAAMPGYLAGVQMQRAEAAPPIKVHTYPVTVRKDSGEDADQRELSSVLAGQLSPPGPEPANVSQ